MERYFHERPAVLLALGALSGCLLFPYLSFYPLVITGAVCVLAGLVLLFRAKGVFALPLALGLVLFSSLLLPVLPKEGGAKITGRVRSSPVREGTTLTVTLGNLYIDGRRTRGELTLTMDTLSAAETGSLVSVRAFVTPEETLASSLSLGTAAAIEEPVITPYAVFSPLIWADRCREKLEKNAERLFSPYAGEANGMLLGDKSGMGYLSYTAYTNSGLMHLMCVSGLHVAIVAGAVLSLIRGKKKYVRLVLTALVLVLYTALTGFSASSLRAALMLFLGRLTICLERQRDALSTIGLAFACLLFINPLYLGDTGFALSFGAVYGLVCLSSVLARREKTGLFSGSLAASLGTLPLMAGTFGGVQWAGVLLSPLAIPAAPFFLIPGWIAILLYRLLPGLARVIAVVPRGVLKYLDFITGLGSFKTLCLPAPGPVSVVLWYTGLFFVSDCFFPNKKQPRVFGCLQLFISLALWLLRAL